MNRFRRWFESQPNEYELSGDDFFLPDLCGAQNLFFMVLVAELLAVSLVLFDVGFAQMNWSHLGLTSLFVQWVVLASAALLCNTRTYLKDLDIEVAVMFAYGMIILVTLAISVAAEMAIGDNGLQVGDLQWSAILNRVLISGILATMALRYLFIQHQLRVQAQAELNARIQALQSRIRPHFLFNSMNIIASLIPVEPETAERVVEDLSVLFRASLSESTLKPVRLRDEIALCEKYLSIEQLRLGDRLRVEWVIEADLDRIEIPLLTLQPLVENAIYHGIQPLPDGGLVQIAVLSQGEQVTISVINPVAPENHQHEEGNRMAVENVRHRLRAIYGPSAQTRSRQDHSSFETVISYSPPRA